jgi:hypothetical protein
MAIASQGNPRRMNDLDLRRELIDRRWVTPSEAAFLIGKSKRMLNRWCTAGMPHRIDSTGQRWIRVQDVHDWIATHPTRTRL